MLNGSNWDKAFSRLDDLESRLDRIERAIDTLLRQGESPKTVADSGPAGSTPCECEHAPVPSRDGGLEQSTGFVPAAGCSIAQVTSGSERVDTASVSGAPAVTSFAESPMETTPETALAAASLSPAADAARPPVDAAVHPAPVGVPAGFHDQLEFQPTRPPGESKGEIVGPPVESVSATVPAALSTPEVSFEGLNMPPVVSEGVGESVQDGATRVMAENPPHMSEPERLLTPWQIVNVTNRKLELQTFVDGTICPLTQVLQDRVAPMMINVESALEELEMLRNRAEGSKAALDRVIEFDKLAMTDPAAVVHDLDEVVEEWRAQEGAHDELALGLAATTRGRLIPVVVTLWERAQNDGDARRVLGELCAVARIELNQPNPGDMYDREQHEVGEWVPGGSRDVVQRPTSPGIMFEGERVQRPKVRVFRG